MTGLEKLEKILVIIWTFLIKLFKIIARVFMYISYVSITILAILTVIDVVRRYLFGMALTGVTEWSKMLLIISMAAMANAVVEGRLISVGVLVDRFPKSVNFFVELLMGALSITFFYIIGTRLIGQIPSSIRFREAYFMVFLPDWVADLFGQVTPFNMPRWPFYGVLGVSFLAMIPATIVYVYERIRNFKSPKERNIFDENPDLAILAHAEANDNRMEGAE